MSDSSHKNDGKPARMQSQDERDAEGFAARKERDASSSSPAEFASEEITGKYNGVELEQHREGRPISDRVKRLEKKHDELTSQRVTQLEGRVDGVVEVIGEWRAEVGQQFGKVTAAIGELAGEVKGLSKVVETTARREQVTYEARVDVGAAAAKAQIDVEAAAQKGAITTVNVNRLKTVQILKITAAAVALVGAVVGLLAIVLKGSC